MAHLSNKFPTTNILEFGEMINLTYKIHIDFYFFKPNFKCSIRKRQTEALFLMVLDYGDIIYRNASVITLQFSLLFSF